MTAVSDPASQEGTGAPTPLPPPDARPSVLSRPYYVPLLAWTLQPNAILLGVFQNVLYGAAIVTGGILAARGFGVL